MKMRNMIAAVLVATGFSGTVHAQESAALDWARSLSNGAGALAQAGEDALALHEYLVDLAKGSADLPDVSGEASPWPVYLEAHESERLAYAGSTWFEIGDPHPAYGAAGLCGAAHSLEGWGPDRQTWPEWTKIYPDAHIIVRPEQLDIACFGVWFAGNPVRPSLSEGQAVVIRGYPGGSTVNGRYEIRLGYVLFERPEEFRGGDAPSYVVTLTNGSTLVIGGMSGGLVTTLPVGFEWPESATVFDRGDVRGKRGLIEADVQRMIGDHDETPVGVLVTQNSRGDYDGDGIEEHSADIVFGVDAYQAVMRCPDCWTYSVWLEGQQ